MSSGGDSGDFELVFGILLLALLCLLMFAAIAVIVLTAYRVLEGAWILVWYLAGHVRL